MPSPTAPRPPFAVVALPAAAGGAFVALRLTQDAGKALRETACCGASKTTTVDLAEAITGFTQACAFPGARARIDTSEESAGALVGSPWIAVIEAAAKAAGELPPPTKKKVAAERQETTEQPAKRQGQAPKGKKESSSIFTQIPVSLCELSVPRPDGQGSHNVCKLPKGTVIDGIDVSGWTLYPRFANHPSLRGDKFVDVPLLKDRSVKLYPPRSNGAAPMEATAAEVCQAVKRAVNAYHDEKKAAKPAAAVERKRRGPQAHGERPGSINAAVGAAIRQAENGV